MVRISEPEVHVGRECLRFGDLDAARPAYRPLLTDWFDTVVLAALFFTHHVEGKALHGCQRERRLLVLRRVHLASDLRGDLFRAAHSLGVVHGNKCSQFGRAGQHAGLWWGIFAGRQRGRLIRESATRWISMRVRLDASTCCIGQCCGIPSCADGSTGCLAATWTGR